jgi:hypothetical protein
MSESKRGSNGGNARKEKLSSERRSEIAKEAAQRRWAKKKEDKTNVINENEPVPYVYPESKTETHKELGPGIKHCPACLAGECLEEGEGTHILATVEHPVEIPVAFRDAEDSVSVSAPSVVPQKTPKRITKQMPKELKTASSYAEKRLPQAIKEKADLLVEVAKREAEIQELTRVIQALGGHNPVGVPTASNPIYPIPQYQPPAYTPPQLPAPYPEYQQPAPVMPVVTPPKPMKAGGAGIASGMLSVPNHWYE